MLPRACPICSQKVLGNPWCPRRADNRLSYISCQTSKNDFARQCDRRILRILAVFRAGQRGRHSDVSSCTLRSPVLNRQFLCPIMHSRHTGWTSKNDFARRCDRRILRILVTFRAGQRGRRSDVSSCTLRSPVLNRQALCPIMYSRHWKFFSVLSIFIQVRRSITEGGCLDALMLGWMKLTLSLIHI